MAVTNPGENARYESLFTSCVAYYDFKGDAKDIIGSNDGVVSGATLTTNHLGITNSAYSFDGVDDYVNTSISLSDKLTYSVWINTNSFSYNNLFILEEATSSDGFAPRGLRIIDDGNSVIFFSRDSSDNYIDISSTTSISAGTWYHIVGVQDGGNLYLYINGNLEDSTSFSSPQTNYENPLHFGYYYLDDKYYFDGLIDNVMVFSRALSPEEVKYIYRSTYRQ